MSRGLNKVSLIGNVGKEPEMRYTPSGQAVVNFSLATSRSRKDPAGTGYIDETEWHRIVLWEKLAETASKYVHKGSKLYLEGRIQSRKYTDNAGVERTSFEIVCHEMVLLDNKSDSNGGGGGERQPVAAAAKGETFASEEFDDVPF